MNMNLKILKMLLIKADLGIDLSVEIIDKIKKNNVKSSELKRRISKYTKASLLQWLLKTFVRK